MAIADQELCWQVVTNHDTSMDGVFFVAVKTTGIYCRPSCRSRTPLRKNVTFLTTADECEAAGFRACKRCRPRELLADTRPELIREACDYLENDPDAVVSLMPVARKYNVEGDYLRRLFKRTLGVTPREYAASHRALRLRHGLRDGASVTQAMYDAGYPSSNRLYEKADSHLGMTPAAYRRGGRGMAIGYEIVDSALGKLLVGATERGICTLRLGDSEEKLEESLRREYPHALIARRPDSTGWIQDVVGFLDGREVRLDMPVDIQATAFQIRVWRALRAIAYGETKSYSQIAREIGNPKAARAVAQACAHNPVALIIPCHRVIQNDGGLGGYALGVHRKKKLLTMESAHREEAAVAAGGA
ncbi:MAG: bifunctional DNA-binding transcriptional regulator/O6-methylguanine-DNA methyltransferase Ada [Chloroflexota bacterium]